MKHLHPVDQAALRAAREANLRSGDALRLLSAAGTENDFCREILDASKDGGRVEIAARDLVPHATRADTVAGGTPGGYLVATGNVGFLELARARSAVMTFGATRLDGLVGNAVLPRLSASIAPTWLASETTAPTDSTQTLGLVSLTPHGVSVNIKVSRTLLEQTSPAAKALLTNDMLAAIGQAVDQAALSGTGSGGQPTGIVNIAGITSISGASFNNSVAVDLQGACAKRLGPTAGYCAAVAVAKVLSKRTRDSSTVSYVWDGGLYLGQIVGEPAIATDDAPASTVIFGEWDQLLIAQWGNLAVEIDPYGQTGNQDFQLGLINLRVITYLDIAVRDPAAFAIATGVS